MELHIAKHIPPPSESCFSRGLQKEVPKISEKRGRFAIFTLSNVRKKKSFHYQFVLHELGGRQKIDSRSLKILTSPRFHDTSKYNYLKKDNMTSD